MEPNTNTALNMNGVLQNTNSMGQKISEQNMAPKIEPATNTDDKKKSSKWMLLALILCLMFAAGGIGFGIWARVDGDNRASSLNEQIANLQEQNADLSGQIVKLNAKIEELKSSSENWAVAEVEDGVFYVKDADGDVIMQSSADMPKVDEIIGCESSSNNTVLNCTVSTSKGEGWILYDVYGDSLLSSFDAE